MPKKLLLSIYFFILSAAFISGCGIIKKADESKESKIGVILSLSGENSDYGKSSKMALDLLKEENSEKSSSDDAKIQFIYEDDESTSEAALTSVRKLIDEDKIDALIISSSSSVCLTAASLAEEKKIPVLVSFATNSRIASLGSYIFRICYDDVFQGNVIAKFAFSDLKAKKAAVIFDDEDEYSKTLSDSFRKSFEKAGGIVVSSEIFSKEEQDFTSITDDIKLKNADVIVIPAYYESADKILKALKKSSIKTTVVGGDGWDSEKILKTAGNYDGDIYFTDHFSNGDSSPEAVKFKSSFNAKYQKDPDSFAALSYDSGKIMIDAIMSSKTDKSYDIKKALSKTESNGVTGEIKFDDSGEIIKKAVIIKIKNGKKVYVKDIYP